MDWRYSITDLSVKYRLIRRIVISFEALYASHVVFVLLDVLPCGQNTLIMHLRRVRQLWSGSFMSFASVFETQLAETSVKSLTFHNMPSSI